MTVNARPDRSARAIPYGGRARAGSKRSTGWPTLPARRGDAAEPRQAAPGRSWPGSDGPAAAPRRAISITSIDCAEAPPASAAASNSQGSTCPPKRSTVQTGSATGFAMPSVAFFRKPAQSAGAPAYMRQRRKLGTVDEVRREPGAPKRPRQFQPVMQAGPDGPMTAHGTVGRGADHHHLSAAGRGATPVGSSAYARREGNRAAAH